MTEPSPWLAGPPGGMSPQLVERMERVARDVARDWGLQIGPRVAAGRYSYVAFAGEHAVLKVIPPEDDQADHIAEALAFWAGRGAVRVLRHDPERRALLLERIRPGTEASALPEEEAIAVAIDVGAMIWRRPPARHPYRSTRDWVARWLPDDGAHRLVRTARETFARMTPRLDVVVHADFHHHNLLLRGREWVAIDPKPIVGEPEFDVPAFLWNPLHTVPTAERTRRRVAAFVRAGLDERRIREWSIVRGICDGLPLATDETEETSPQMCVALQLL